MVEKSKFTQSHFFLRILVRFKLLNEYPTIIHQTCYTRSIIHLFGLLLQIIWLQQKIKCAGVCAIHISNDACPRLKFLLST